jgi:hypothetical protein
VKFKDSNFFVENELIITSVEEAMAAYESLQNFRFDWVHKYGQRDLAPYYRGEQKLGWDIRPGVFRPPFEAFPFLRHC